MGSIEILSVASTVPEQHVASKDILNQASKKLVLKPWKCLNKWTLRIDIQLLKIIRNTFVENVNERL